MMPYPQPMITKIPPSWAVHEQGQEPIHGIKVIQWPPGLSDPSPYYQCEVHGFWLPNGFKVACTHITQAKEDADAEDSP